VASFIPGLLSYIAALSIEESVFQMNRIRKQLQDILGEIEVKLRVCFFTIFLIRKNVFQLISKQGAKLRSESELSLSQSYFDYEKVDFQNGESIKLVNKKKLNSLLASLIINETYLNHQLNICETLNHLVKEWPHLVNFFYLLNKFKLFDICCNFNLFAWKYAEILTVYIYKIRVSNNPQLIEMLLRAMVDMVTKKVIKGSVDSM
jgi:hypothetical protein